MRKTIMFLLLFTLTFLSSMFVVRALNSSNTLVVYYYRYDNDYTNFNIWLWQNEPVGKDGIKFDFNNEDVDSKYGAFVEIDLVENSYSDTTRFGIIVKKGDWGGYAEPGGDRFFNKDNMEIIDGKYRVYVVEQDLNIGTNNNDLNNNIPDYSPKTLKADFTVTERINLTFSEIPTEYQILENGVSIHTESPTEKNLSIKLNKKVDLLKSYVIKATFTDGLIHERVVSITNLYDTETFINSFTYEGKLGSIYEETKTTFRLWAPISESVTLNLYNQGHPNYDRNGNKKDELTPKASHTMTKIENGAWEVIVNGNLENQYYTFSVTNYGQTHEVTDPYSYSTGANGLRSMITNFDSLNPENWEYNKRPETITNLTDYIVYELHVRDLTSHSSWTGPEKNRGKFLGFTNSGTTYTNREGITVTTGLEHLDELGINAVQLLPIFDFGYIDEVEMALNPNYSNTFNWGYMPYHFNTLEGSYSTNPFDGGVRVNEFKQLINSLHSRDIRVIMDVVYNHTGESATSNFHKILPGYYHRLVDGNFSNGSGTGNETASERSMVRKFMKDSLKFLATEYNLSGFRFDLMELHDVETMKEIEDMLFEIDPTIVIYGEPWAGGDTPLENSKKAGKDNIKAFKNVGAFNDITRDAIKGSTFGGNVKDGAWVQGKKTNEHYENVKYGIAGGINHQDVSTKGWHLSPQKTINYVSAHDNNTLHDKLSLTGVKGDELQRMLIQANAIILTSQGIPFLHAGVEFMRSKPATDGGFDENSYESPDEVNQLRWDRKARYIDVFEYYKTLIHLRKYNPQFRMNNTNDINNYLRFVNTNNSNVIQFEINHPSYPHVVIVHNTKGTSYTATMPQGKTFNLYTSMLMSSVNPLITGVTKIPVTTNTTAILIEETTLDDVSVEKETITIKKGTKFDLLSNIKYPENIRNIKVNSFVNTNISGKYLVSVTIIDSKGNLIPLSYTLIVSGAGSNVSIYGGRNS